MINSNGAGVILDDKGIIATNTHIIFNSRSIIVTLVSGEELPANVIHISRSDDFSLLKIETKARLPPIVWADSNLAQLGDAVITLGHSEILSNTISGGQIRAIGIRKQDPDRTPEFFELDINHYQGDSGGPLFDRQGRFLGLISAKRLTEDRSCLAIPSNKIHFAYINLAEQ